MSAVHIGPGFYTYRKDKDEKGVYYWIVDPAGKDLVPVDTMGYVQVLLPHLNRSSPKRAKLNEGLHVIAPEAPGIALSPFPMLDGT